MWQAFVSMHRIISHRKRNQTGVIHIYIFQFLHVRIIRSSIDVHNRFSKKYVSELVSRNYWVKLEIKHNTRTAMGFS